MAIQDRARMNLRLHGSRTRHAVSILLVGVAISALPSLSRAQVAVPFSASVQFTTTSQVATYIVDLGTLPSRPELIVDAIPTGTNPNIQLQIEITDFQFTNPAFFPNETFCPAPTDRIVSTSGTGPAQLVWKTWVCRPETGELIGETARVNVRVTSFGSAGAPANVQIAMRGITSPPTGTQLMPYWTPGVQQTITLRPTKDTTIYERNRTNSNGAGQFLWAGRDVNTVSPFAPFAVRSLVSFPLRGGPIPSNATINSVNLRLDVESILGSGNTLQVWSYSFNPIWTEGIADAPGNEFQGSPSAVSAANWNVGSTAPDVPWGFGSSSGGDPLDLLDSQAVTTTGVKSFTSTALRTYVGQMLTNTSSINTRDGLILRGTESSSTSSGLQLASRENGGVGATPPELVVTFTVPVGPQQSNPTSGAVPFIQEGQNLRWIYDLDFDDVYVTPVSGVCTANPNPFAGQYFVPYSYAFNGTPGYTGVDCCTWRIESAQSATVGTGQLIFYHNLDASNPANTPPDTDRDGIRNLCDNCPLKANGPLLGSCLTGPKAGGPCRSNQECTTGLCSLSQEDANGDKTGDACVPEPGFAALLSAGLLGLVGLGRRRPTHA